MRAALRASRTLVQARVLFGRGSGQDRGVEAAPREALVSQAAEPIHGHERQSMSRDVRDHRRPGGDLGAAASDEQSIAMNSVRPAPIVTRDGVLTRGGWQGLR